MCSIIGCYRYKNNVDKEFSVDSTVLNFIIPGFEVMRHRGPDSEAIKIINENLVFGHQRLSIIDLSDHASQPMVGGGGVLIFNGEIYNYAELVESQLFEIEPMHAKSDTGILLNLLNQHGVNGFSKLNGMFAFAYFNDLTNDLILCRDRFGVKPLYYVDTGEVLYFSSEITPLLKTGVNFGLNLNLSKKYLSDTATDFDENTLITNICQVQPGSYLKISGGKIEEVSWYQIPGNIKIGCQKQAEDNYEELLVDAIRLRMNSDVPVCITLSGGIDSTTIYTLIKERLKRPIHVFTYDHPGADSSELSLVRWLVNKYGDELTVVTGNEFFGLDMDGVTAGLNITELPIWSFSSEAYEATYKKIHEMGFKVVIEGHGADEFLGGYSYMIRQLVVESFRARKVELAIKYFKIMLATDGRNEISYANYLKEMVGCILSSLYLRGNSTSFVDTLKESVNYKILPIVLRAFDRLSMAHSVESRAPFMDYRVAEAGFSLFNDSYVDEIGNKAVLRRILKKYGNAKIYETKRKRGYSSDIVSIFKNKELITQLNELLLGSRLIKIFPKEVECALKILNDSIAFNESNTFEISKLALLALLDKKINEAH